MCRRCILAVSIITILFVGCTTEENGAEPTSLPFSDGFEAYAVGDYPAARGWYMLWDGTGSSNTHVVDDTANSGEKSFLLSGYPNWIRTDGVTFDLSGVNRLTYEVAVMIPSGSATGSYVGFFVRVSSNESRMYNAVFFMSGDSSVYAHGITSTNTGMIWAYDTWYSVKVEIDYDSLQMDVWVDGQQVASDVDAANINTSHTFCVSTQWASISGVSTSYFDDVEVYETPSKMLDANAAGRAFDSYSSIQ